MNIQAYSAPTEGGYVKRFCDATCTEGDGMSAEGPHTFKVKVYCCQDDYCNGGIPGSRGTEQQVASATMSIICLVTFLLLRF